VNKTITLKCIKCPNTVTTTVPDDVRIGIETYECFACCGTRSMFDGMTPFEIFSKGFGKLYRGRRTHEEWQEDRRASRRRSSKKFRSSGKGQIVVMRSQLKRRRAGFTLESWTRRVQVDFFSRCGYCDEGLHNSWGYLTFSPRRSRLLRDAIPACETCKNRRAGARNRKSICELIAA
jgi:hypothetical protein